MAQSDLRNLKMRFVAPPVGPGNVTVTGIKKGDKLLFFAPTTALPNGDGTSEFTVTADNTINNAGGSNYTGTICLVAWVPKNARQ